MAANKPPRNIFEVAAGAVAKNIKERERKAREIPLQEVTVTAKKRPKINPFLLLFLAALAVYFITKK
jgi:hypothetical protein